MNKPDKSYGDIRHEAKLAHMEKYINPIGYAKSIAMEQIDNINNIKLLIKVYFSDDVQRDETPMGAMRRNQIRKELLQFADK